MRLARSVKLRDRLSMGATILPFPRVKHPPPSEALKRLTDALAEKCRKANLSELPDHVLSDLAKMIHDYREEHIEAHRSRES